jgi:protein-tyrosine phosphatase
MSGEATMDISQITDYLYIASLLKAEDAQAVRERNVRLIINMIFIRPPAVYTRPPFRMLTLRSFDFVLLPIPIRKLEKGVEAALPVIRNGESVLVYCHAGRHRSVAMACSILIAMGSTADEAMQLVRERREVADPYARHIERQIKKFEEQWWRENK